MHTHTHTTKTKMESSQEEAPGMGTWSPYIYNSGNPQPQNCFPSLTERGQDSPLNSRDYTELTLGTPDLPKCPEVQFKTLLEENKAALAVVGQFL